MPRIRTLLVSRSTRVAAEIEQVLHDHPTCRLSTKIVSNGHADPLHDVSVTPDVLVLHCDASLGELQFLADSASPDRAPLIVIGPPGSPEAMRLAMRAGAADYLTSPLQPSDLIDAVDRLAARFAGVETNTGELVTVVNSRGGSGASFLAANIAYELFSASESKKLLVDFDLQFGGLCRYFDMNPKKGIIEALDAVEDLDEVSGETYITRHKSGMRLLAARSDTLCMANEISVARIEMLFRMLLQYNEYVVVDLPRRIDVLAATVLESSDHILLVVQQSLSHLYDAKRMIRLITQELRVPENRITIVVNRHDKKSIIEVDDVKTALKIDRTLEIPNQYDLVADSINTGKPLVDRNRSSAVTKAIVDLCNRMRGVSDAATPQSLLQRALPAILKRTT